ncbi:phosphate/phosphite/phosphonate ABC transporter substrate-binding protein [Nocardioides sp. KC13]|uniref:Phosphate/phosphite/phosphonate ABC transporter substrate-binding protein n=1 Tax=Nocardioides turkmenicus TaxID=2711220 RepID=A0A6M1R336_9ACTN|nr:phosphate/phosphite/phosphonate ABC transporter substrate-binding protein [Nocardioides sp. KC13]NGN94330.1 phosphate/phosphite/phosphonate ABC transporter substrate-binding protein [Nocardioides sp. KC13]
MSKLRSLTALAGAATLTLALAACGSEATPEPADAAAAGGKVGPDQICPDGTLTMGVEPFEDPKNLIPVYETLGKALGEELGCEVDVQISDTYVAEILAMQNGKLDIGQFGPLGYVFAQKQAGATPLASFAGKDGKVSSYTGGIWVPKDSPVTSVEDLKGKTLALSESGSTSGDAVPRKALIDAGIEKDVKAEYAGGHTEALLALVNGKVDAAEINSQTLASATAEGQFDESAFRQVWESEPILNDPIAAGPNMTPEVSKAVQEALLSLPAESVEKIGEYLDFTPPAGKPALVAVTEEDYQPVSDLADALDLTTDDL